MDKSPSQRNATVDILRGLAMLLVVLGHTLTGCINDAEHSFIFNVIWALQMPLFILISGYVTKYSRPINDANAFWKVIKKRTIAYMLPWLVWTVVIRGIILGHSEYLNFKWLVFHMDSGYWFLFTIWVISLIYASSVYLASKVKKDGLWNMVALTCFYGCFAIIVLGVGLLFGLSFLGTKLTLYYIPFYFLGVIFGRYQYLIDKHTKIKEVLIAVAAVAFISIISRCYLYDLEDSVGDVLLRFVASISGCAAICGLVGPLCQKATKTFWGGVRVYRNALNGDLSNSLSPSNPDKSNSSRKTRNVLDTSIELSDNDCAVYNNNCINRAEQNTCENTIWKRNKELELLNFFGKTSLEVYLLHGLVLCPIKTSVSYTLHQAGGTVLALSNFVITMGIVFIVIKLLEGNKIVQKVLFGKNGD